MNALRLDDHYRGRRVPPWLRHFEAEPVEALHDLLLGRALLGHLDPAEPERVLCDWMEGLGEPLVRSVDQALTAWIERYWGTPILPGSAESAALCAEAWRRAMDVVGIEERLEEAPAALRTYLPDRRDFLAALRLGRACDPEGRAWLALARHQRDEGLLALWWWLVELPPDVPFYHGAWGIHGLRRLETEGGFPSRVAEGLVRLGRALERRAEEGWLEEEKAESEFLRAARITIWAYNFHNRWLPFWRQALPLEGEEDRPFHEWVRKLYPEKLKHAHGQSGKQQHRQLSTTLEEIKDIRYRLGRPDDEVIAEARTLLRAQQDYAEATGDTHFVVRTAVSFAGRVRRKRPELALEWTRLGRQFDPDNAHAWTTEASVLLELTRFDAARRMAFEAVRRFPYNDVALTTLAEVLRAQGHFENAESVYREACQRFPDNPVARTGHGDVLRAQGRLDEAEAAYREVLSKRQNDAAQAGLRHVERLRREPKRGFELAESKIDYDTGSFEPDDIEIVLQDAFLLRHWARDRDPAARRKRARQLLERLAETSAQNPAAAGEHGLLALEHGHLAETLDLLRRAADRFPGSARVRYALAAAERAAARRSHHASPEHLRPWKKLHRLDHRLRPLQLLGEARILLEDPGAQAGVRDRIGELGWWIERTLGNAERAQLRKQDSTEPFNVAWSRELRQHLFDGHAIGRAEDIDDLDAVCRNLVDHERELAYQEETYLAQVSVI